MKHNPSAQAIPLEIANLQSLAIEIDFLASGQFETRKKTLIP